MWLDLKIVRNNFLLNLQLASLIKGSRQKKGGGVKGRAIKEKRTFFRTFFSNVPKFQRPLSSRGEGG